MKILLISPPMVAMLKPALDRVASDPSFRAKLESTPLDALAEVGVVLDAETRAEFSGRRFSEFWNARRAQAEGPVEIRDLPPAHDELDDAMLDAVAGGLTSSLVASAPAPSFAPPYVPMGPSLSDDSVKKLR